MADAATSVLEFVQARGVTVERVEPDGRCGVYDPYNRVAYICRELCSGRRGLVESRLLAQVD